MRFIIILIFFFIAGLLNGQIPPEKPDEKYSISGNITDSHGESLIGANIYVSELNVGTSSNNYGFYSLTLPKGIYNIVYSYIGFNTETKQVIDSIKFGQNKNEPKVFDVLLYAQEPPEDNYYYWGLMKDQYPVTTSLDKLRFANDDLINGNYLSGLQEG